MDSLPPELVFRIAHFLDPIDIVRLQSVSRQFYILFRDSKLWRSICFEKSQYETSRRRRLALMSMNTPRMNSELSRNSISPALRDAVLERAPPRKGIVSKGVPYHCDRDRKRAIANWDPEYVGEEIDWYSEYIARHAPIAMSWLQRPAGTCKSEVSAREARGVGLFKDRSNGERSMAVAPLDDGSVCIWDIERSYTEDDKKTGSILARSQSRLLAVEGIQQQKYAMAKMTFMGVDACVSIENTQKKAYFAIHDRLTEVDLETLQVVSEEKYSSFISALSPVQHPVPLTVGTSNSLHLFDPRVSHTCHLRREESLDRCDVVTTLPASEPTNPLRGLLYEDASLYAQLSEPGPLSILHLSSGDCSGEDGEIFVAGRFPSVLVYDRRNFPKLRSTIHSGAQLSSLAFSSHPFYSTDSERMKMGRLTLNQLTSVKSKPGYTLIACGDYRGRGSLELYGLVNDQADGRLTEPIITESGKPSEFRNRQTASKSKLLSVATHGSRIAFSDADGMIKWVERDGTTLVRRWNINPYQYKYYAPGGAFNEEVSHGDVARKILSTSGDEKPSSIQNDNLLVWTGERIGLLHFAQEPWFSPRDFEDAIDEVEDGLHRSKEETYHQRMREALENHANDAGFLRSLGLRDPAI